MLAGIGAWAQASTDNAPAAMVSAERARIAAERARLDKEFAAEQVACQQRFVVTSCVDKARIKQRSVREELRRQEVLLNDGERRRKTAEQHQRLDEKQQERDSATPERAIGAEPRTRPAPAPSSRVPRNAPSQESRARDEARHEEEARRRREAHDTDDARRAATAANAGEEERRHAEKLRDAAEHKARVLRENAAKPTTAKPLPPP